MGNDVASAWATILAGRSGIGPVTRFDTASFPTHFGGEIRQLDLEPYMSTKDARRMDAFMQYGVVAGMQAMRDSGLAVTESNADRIGILMGSGMGGLESIEEAYDRYLDTSSPKKVSPFFIPASIINLVSGHLSIAFEITGPNLAVATACTTSTHALGLGDAADSVRRCRRDAGRRVGNGHLRHRHERLRPSQSPVTAQRRPAGRQPPLGQGPRRLRHGRRRRRDDARGIRISQGSRREDLR